MTNPTQPETKLEPEILKARNAFVKIIKDENFYSSGSKWSLKWHWTGAQGGFADEMLQRRWMDFLKGWNALTAYRDWKAGKPDVESEDTKRLDAIAANKWTVCWNELHNAFIVQRKEQVVGNIAHGPLRGALDAAMRAQPEEKP